MGRVQSEEDGGVCLSFEYLHLGLTSRSITLKLKGEKGDSHFLNSTLA